MEEKIAKITLSIIGGSYILAILLFLILFGITSIASGDFNLIKNPFMLQGFFIVILYIFSIILLATLPGKSIRQRLVSWLYSIIFHAGLLFYLGLITKFGLAILIVGLVEVIVLMLSMAGLFTLFYSYRAKKDNTY